MLRLDRDSAALQSRRRLDRRIARRLDMRPGRLARIEQAPGPTLGIAPDG